jgi:tetratricopeptide (TPR) repeat protein
MELRPADPLPRPLAKPWEVCWHLPCFAPNRRLPSKGIPSRRRLIVKRALVLLPFLLAPAASPAAEKLSSQEVKFGIEVAEKGMWREALFRFEKAVEIDPQNPSALNNLAVALEQMGEFQKARANYERALELRPDDLYIQQNYDLFREADDKRNRKKRRRRR